MLPQKLSRAFFHFILLAIATITPRFLHSHRAHCSFLASSLQLLQCSVFLDTFITCFSFCILLVSITSQHSLMFFASMHSFIPFSLKLLAALDRAFHKRKSEVTPYPLQRSVDWHCDISVDETGKWPRSWTRGIGNWKNSKRQQESK